MALIQSMSNKEKQKLKAENQSKNEIFKLFHGKSISLIKLLADYFISTNKWNELSSNERSSITTTKKFPFDKFDQIGNLFEYLIEQLYIKNTLLRDSVCNTKSQLSLINKKQNKNGSRILDIKKFKIICNKIFIISDKDNFGKFLEKSLNDGFYNASLCDVYHFHLLDLSIEEKLNNKNEIKLLKDQLDKQIKEFSNKLSKNSNNKQKLNKDNKFKSKNIKKENNIKIKSENSNNRSKLDLELCKKEKKIIGIIEGTNIYKVRGFCNNYNSGKDCDYFKSCWYLHICSFCLEASHGRNTCFKLKNNNNK